jgi:hypothetical protein
VDKYKQGLIRRDYNWLNHIKVKINILNLKGLNIISLILVVFFLFLALPFSENRPAFAAYPPSILKWSIVDTPSNDGNVIRPVSDTN